MTTAPFSPLVEDTRPSPETPFQRAFHAFLDGYFAAYPVWATLTGHHLLDHLWGDFSEDGRLTRLAMVDEQERIFRELPEADLSPDERIDRGIMLELLDHLRFEEGVLREPSWDPLAYVYVAGSGLFGCWRATTLPGPTVGTPSSTGSAACPGCCGTRGRT